MTFVPLALCTSTYIVIQLEELVECCKNTLRTLLE